MFVKYTSADEYWSSSHSFSSFETRTVFAIKNCANEKLARTELNLIFHTVHNASKPKNSDINVNVHSLPQHVIPKLCVHMVTNHVSYSHCLAFSKGFLGRLFELQF